ncbi:MAG: hypothetical protein GY715_19520 [Planctomycetes bacterium]|nr:hypothetical protein [Planctomycetota bacterium]
MKRKGITIWEQHIEHIVLGCAVLFFLVFAVLQFIGEPNSVDMQPGGKVKPGEIDGRLEQTASSLEKRLTPDAPPSFDIPDHEPVVDVFNEGIAARIANRGVIPSHMSVAFGEGSDRPRDVAYVVPEIAAPFSVVADQYFDAVLAEEVDAHESLQDLLPEAPHDLTWVTTAARFDLEKIWEEFRRSGPNDARPLPVNWYDDRITIIDVKVEREEKVDGIWTDLRTLDALPGQVSVREQIAGDTDRSVRDEILNRLFEEDEQVALIRPPFLGTANASWTPPDPRVSPEQGVQGLSEEQRKLIDVTRQLSLAVAKRDKLMKEYEDAGGSASDIVPPKEEEPEERGRRGDEDEKGKGTGKDRRAPPPDKKAPPGGSFGFGNSGADDATTDRQAALKRLKQQLLRQEQIITRRSRQLAALGGDAAGVLADAEASDPGNMSSDEVVVWAHDIAIEPNRTYRYRFTIELYNPFFARKLDLREEQHHFAESITLASEASDWSDGIRAIPPLKVYVTKADGEQGSLGLGQATAEVFRFYYGRWWRREFPVQPGDRIGALKTRREADSAPESIDYGTDWFVLDIIHDPDAGREAETRGLAAQVLLQHRSDSSQTMLLDPRAVGADAERSRLRDLVDQAGLADEVASAGP